MAKNKQEGVRKAIITTVVLVMVISMLLYYVLTFISR